MAYYRLDCSCGAALEVDTAQAGDHAACASCGQQVQIPAFRELKLLPRVDQPTLPAAPQWSTRRNFVFVAIFCVTGGAGIGLITATVLRTRLLIDFTSDDHVRVQEERVDLMNAPQTLVEWNSMIEEGIEGSGTPVYVVYLRRARRLKMWIIGCGIVMALGLIAMVAVARTARTARTSPPRPGNSTA